MHSDAKTITIAVIAAISFSTFVLLVLIARIFVTATDCQQACADAGVYQMTTTHCVCR